MRLRLGWDWDAMGLEWDGMAWDEQGGLGWSGDGVGGAGGVEWDGCVIMLLCGRAVVQSCSHTAIQPWRPCNLRRKLHRTLLRSLCSFS